MNLIWIIFKCLTKLLSLKRNHVYLQSNITQVEVKYSVIKKYIHKYSPVFLISKQ